MKQLMLASTAAIGLLALTQPAQAAQPTWYVVMENCLPLEEVFVKWAERGGIKASVVRSSIPKLPHTPDELITFYREYQTGVSIVDNTEEMAAISGINIKPDKKPIKVLRTGFRAIKMETKNQRVYYFFVTNLDLCRSSSVEFNNLMQKEKEGG